MKQGFDDRIVNYEHIHNIQPEDWNAFMNIISPQPNEKILDAMCGYGAVAKGILSRESGTKVYLVDESLVQIQRARDNLPELSESRFIHASLLKSGFNDQYFDTVVIKMGLHEVPEDEQVLYLEEIMRLLRERGRVVIWDVILDQHNQKLFQDIVRKKDELAGFDMLVQERYLFRKDELEKNLSITGFHDVQEKHTMQYRFSTKKRLESELKNNPGLLEQLNNYIRERFDESLKQVLHFEDKGDDIQFTVQKKIYQARK